MLKGLIVSFLDLDKFYVRSIKVVLFIEELVCNLFLKMNVLLMVLYFKLMIKPSKLDKAGISTAEILTTQILLNKTQHGDFFVTSLFFIARE